MDKGLDKALKGVLKEFAADVRAEYNRLCASHKPYPKTATGKLSKSVPKVRKKSGEYQALLNIEEYYANVEYGRGKNKKQPPYKSILSWVNTRKIGEAKKRKSIAFAISRSIARRGIPPTHYMQKAVDTVFPKYEDAIRGVGEAAALTLIGEVFEGDIQAQIRERYGI